MIVCSRKSRIKVVLVKIVFKSYICMETTDEGKYGKRWLASVGASSGF